MKKLFIMATLLFGASTFFAVHQYDIGRDGVQINQNMSLSLHVSGNSLFKNYEKIGFYVQNADGTYRNQTFNSCSQCLTFLAEQ